MKRDLWMVLGALANVLLVSWVWFWVGRLLTRGEDEPHDHGTHTMGNPTITWGQDATFQTGIMYDGSGRFAIVKDANVIWRGTHDDFTALVASGLACSPAKETN